MCNPTAQDYHSNHRVDDVEICDDDRLLRHLCLPVHIREVNGALRVSDQAFTFRKDDVGVSVDLECLLLKDGLSERDRRGKMHNAHGLLAINAGVVREFGQGVAWTPKPEETGLQGFAALPNPYHGEIFGRLARSETRKVALRATVLWVSGGVELGPYDGQAPEVG